MYKKYKEYGINLYSPRNYVIARLSGQADLSCPGSACSYIPTWPTCPQEKVNISK